MATKRPHFNLKTSSLTLSFPTAMAKGRPRIIENRIIPFGTFYAINLFGVLFVKHGTKLEKTEVNHEYIHTLQQMEMLFIFFYLWYGVEYLVKLCKYRNSFKAYVNLSFEREAYANMNNLQYTKHRKHFAWRKYIKVKGK